MAGIPVSGASFGLAASAPVGLTSTSTNAEKIAAYELLSYVKPASCIVTALPVFDEFWETNTDDDTVCDNVDEIRGQFKTIQAVADSSLSAIFEKSDPLIQMFVALRESRSDVGTIEFTHSDTTNKIWAQVQIIRTVEDPTDVLGKVKFSADFFYEKKPVRN